MISGMISCVSITKPETEKLKNNFANIRAKIQKDRSYINVLMKERIGKTGYYYIISSNGIVIAHPQAFLKGADYSKFSFIQDILNNKSGCTSYTVTDKEFTIIHEPLNVEEVLCLTIQSNELSDEGAMCKKSNFGQGIK
jgi:hypothetical protein